MMCEIKLNQQDSRIEFEATVNKNAYFGIGLGGSQMTGTDMVIFYGKNGGEVEDANAPGNYVNRDSQQDVVIDSVLDWGTRFKIMASRPM